MSSTQPLGAAALTGASPASASEEHADTPPWAGGSIPLAARSSRQMTQAVRAFLASLDMRQRALVRFPELGDQTRTRWSNLPPRSRPRPGIALGDLTDAQRILLHDLLRASTSSQGYHKMTGAIRAEEVLHHLRGGRAIFSPAFYYVSIYGSAEGDTWAWMLTGHHMSAIFTVAGERTGFTPMFTGAQPIQIPDGVYAGWQVLPRDAARAGDLLAALSADQRHRAVIGAVAPDDVLAGPGRQASLTSFQGIPSGHLDREQQRLLWLLVQEFVANADTDAAEAQLDLIRAGWADTHFAWIGPPPEPTSRYYFRVHGPRILIEYNVEEPTASNGGHVHAITRDPLNDYGADWLGLHYQEHHTWTSIP